MNELGGGFGNGGWPAYTNRYIQKKEINMTDSNLRNETNKATKMLKGKNDEISFFTNQALTLVAHEN